MVASTLKARGKRSEGDDTVPKRQLSTTQGSSNAMFAMRPYTEYRTRVNGTEQKERVQIPRLHPRRVTKQNEWRLVLKHHLYVCTANEGARELADELNQWWAHNPGVRSYEGDGPLKIAYGDDSLSEHERTVLLSQSAVMVVLLNAVTWVDPAQRKGLAKDVCTAMELGVRLILAHEMPGADKQAADRRACDFGVYFGVDRGQHRTPKFLKEEGLYNLIVRARSCSSNLSSTLILAVVPRLLPASM